MDIKLNSKAEKFHKRYQRRKLWQRIVSGLSCVVVFFTTYALILPAITEEQETFCGLESHVHEDACYVRMDEQEQVLICSEETLNLHAHTDACYDADGNRICGQADYVVHAHAEGCFDQMGNLICTLPEREQHVHTQACYAAPEGHVHTEDCFVLERGALICELAEEPGHMHEAACYVPGETVLCQIPENHVHEDACSAPVLTCQMAEGHVHGEDCFVKTLVCAEEGEAHTHEDACYASELICALEENHEHGEACFTAQLVCTIAEGHVHDASCMEQILVCEIAESEGYAHGDDCYEQVSKLVCTLEETTEEPVLICTEPQAQIHVHSDACYEAAKESELTCGLAEDENHSHGKRCYGVWALNCMLPEHEHTLSCYSDSNADVETAAGWEQTMANVELGENLRENVLLIAQSQLGYRESTRNYMVLEDGETIKGYSRYGAWYGLPYGDWCAMFTSFCLYYAEAEDMPLHCTVPDWIEELKTLDLYRPAAEYLPEPGDLIFFDWDQDGLGDHAGFVSELIPETEEEPAKIMTIQGNTAHDTVGYVSYELDDEDIMGYSLLLEYFCGQDVHTHDASCLDEGCSLICVEDHIHGEGCYDVWSLVCGMEEHVHEAQCRIEPVEEPIVEDNSAEENPAEEQTEEDEILAETVYYCGLEEHTHEDACFGEDGTVQCGMEEHAHEEACLQEPAPELPTESGFICEEEHVHSAECVWLTQEDAQRVADMQAKIYALPTVESFEEKLEQYDAEEDYDGYERYYLSVMEQVRTTQNSYEELEDYEKLYLTDTTRLDDLSPYAEMSMMENEQPTYCGISAHVHIDSCYDLYGNLICTMDAHVHTDICYIEPDGSVMPEGNLSGQTMYHREARRYYQVSSYHTSGSGSGTGIHPFILVRDEDKNSWTPNPTSGWSASKPANYVVTYCIDYNISHSKTGASYDTYLLNDSLIMDKSQRDILMGIVANSYPYISETEMKNKLIAAGILTSGTSCGMDEFIAATQIAIWQTTTTPATTFDSLRRLNVDDFNSFNDIALVNSTHKTSDACFNDVIAIKNWLLKQRIADDIQVSSKTATYTKDATTGLYTVSVQVKFNRALTTNETAACRIAVKDLTSDWKTTTNSDTVNLTLTGVAEWNLAKYGVDLEVMVDGQRMQVYFYDNPDYQDMISGDWESYKDDYHFKLGKGSEVVSVGVSKVWNGEQVADSVTVQLMANGVPCLEPVVLSAANNWRYVWTDLPKINAFDKEFVYTVYEEPVEGCTTKIEEANTTNETFTIAKWIEQDPFDKNNDTPTFEKNAKYLFVLTNGALGVDTLSNGSKGLVLQSVDLSSPLTTPENLIWNAYHVYENNPDGPGHTAMFQNVGTKMYLQYEKNGEGTFTVSGTKPNESTYGGYYYFNNGKLFNITTDEELNYFHYLYSATSYPGWAKVTTSESASPTFTLYKLGTETVKAQTYNFVITNTPVKDIPLTKVTVDKQWTGSLLGVYPASVQVNLLQNGTVIGSAELNAANNWHYEWKDLPIYKEGDSGEKHIYSVSEEQLLGYDKPQITMTGSAEEGYQFVVINNKSDMKPKDIVVEKEWIGRVESALNDPDNPVELKVNLYRNNVLLETVKLTKDNGWKYQWTDMPTRDDYGNDIEYRVEETELTNFDTYYSYSETEDQITFKITNVYQIVSVTLHKRILDDSSGSLLAGAEFDLWQVSADADTVIPGTSIKGKLLKHCDTNGTVQSDGTVKGAGQVWLGNLIPNTTYYLVETKAPPGYNLLPKPIGFIPRIDHENPDAAKRYYLEFTSDLPKDYAIMNAAKDEGDYYNGVFLKVFNEPGYKLPKTGGTGTIPYTAGGALLMMAACLLLMYNHRKRRREDFQSS